MTELLAETDEPATTAGTPVPGSEDRPSRQEISKDTVELNATIRQWDRSPRPSHQAAGGYAFLSGSRGISKTDRVLGHTHLNTFTEEKPYNVCSQTAVESNQKPESERELGNPCKLETQQRAAREHMDQRRGLRRNLKIFGTGKKKSKYNLIKTQLNQNV